MTAESDALATPRPGRQRVDAWIVVAFVVAAVAIRAPGLNPSTLWLDDAWPSMVHKVDSIGEVLRMGVTAPGFSASLKAVFSLFGFSELSAQAIPFLAATATPAVVYALARRWGIGRVSALLGGVLLLLAPLHVTYSTNVKQYAPDLLIGLILLHFAWSSWPRASDDRLRRLALASAGAMVFSASLAPIALVTATVPAMMRIREGEWRAATWPAMLIAYTGALALVIRRWTPDSLEEFWDAGLSTGVVDPFVVTGRLLEGFTGARSLAIAVGLLLVVVLLRAEWPVRLLLLGPIAAAGFLTYFGVPLGTGRTDIYLYGPIAVGASAGLNLLPVRELFRGVAVVAVTVLLAVPWPLPGYADDDGHMQEDVSPFIEEVLPVAEGEVIVTLASHFALALYSPWPIELHEAPSSTTGWWPAIPDEYPALNWGWPLTEEEMRDDFPQPTANVVHVIGASYSREMIDASERIMAAHGYSRVDRQERRGGWWDRYERR